MNLIQWWQKYIKQCILRAKTYYWFCWSYKGVACPPWPFGFVVCFVVATWVDSWSPHDPLSYLVHRWCLLIVLILYLKERYWTLSLCVIFARSLLMLHVISCCTIPVTGLFLLHLPCGHFAPAWPWPVSWVDCGFFHSVTVSLFLGGMWLLHQCDRHLFLFTFLVDYGSFNKAEKPIP